MKIVEYGTATVKSL